MEEVEYSEDYTQYINTDSADDSDLYYYDNDEEESAQNKTHRNKKKGFFAKIGELVAGMDAWDKAVVIVGIAVMVLAGVTFGTYISAKAIDSRLEELATVGSAIENIETIGGSGLMAAADARMSSLTAAREALEAEKAMQLASEQNTNYNEVAYNKDVTVGLNMVSVLKDLKIKFNNKESGKLISNVPFTVSVTTPGGKSETWTDDDMDGIIYKKNIDAGTYKVSVNALSGEKYLSYTLPGKEQSVEVKKEIEYKKVDVKNEIKKESEVNAAKEDTKKNETVVESTLNDTVTWVESKEIASTYREISKNEIAEPLTLSYAGSFMRTAAVMDASGNEVSQPTLIPEMPQPTPEISQAEIILDKTQATAALGQNVNLTVAFAGVTDVVAFSAYSSDNAIATVSVQGNTVVITPVAVGSVTITIEHPYLTNVKAACTVTVKNDPRTDSVSKLKDKSGNQLYVLENDAYREAVYADYYTAEKFFVKGEAKYTGWQTIGGKIYFFDSNGNKVTGEQVIQGAKYNFASDGSLMENSSGTKGIDVSKWNGSIDWNAVKNSGISYVIIRCGYRGSTQGALIEDSKFSTNIKGATAAGLKVGVYFFTQAVDEVEAVEEASMVIEMIRGYTISYPVYLDVEPSGGRGDKISKAQRTAVCKSFCATMQTSGYTSGVYANRTWLSEKLDAGELGAYKIWLAQYAATPTYTGRYDMWQYKSTGKVSGIKGDVDMNISYLGY